MVNSMFYLSMIVSNVKALHLRGDTEPLLLHIGPLKTGSTTFQNQLKVCADRGLYEGLYSDIYGAKGNICEVAFARRANCEQTLPCDLMHRTAEAVESFVKHVPGRKIMSCEWFAGFAEEDFGGMKAIRALRDVTSDYSTSVVFLYRSGVSLALSIYNEKFKHRPPRAAREGGPIYHLDLDTGRVQNKLDEKPPIVPLSQWEIPWDQPLMSCDVIGKYVEVFGRERVKVIDYDGLKANGADLADTLLNSAGMPPLPKVCKGENENEAVSLDGELIMLSFSEHIKNHFNCTLNASAPVENTVAELESLSPPRLCSDLEEVQSLAWMRDTDCRAKYGDLFLMSNSTATFHAMKEKLPYCQVHVEEMLTSSKWQSILTEQYVKLSRTLSLCI